MYYSKSRDPKIGSTESRYPRISQEIRDISSYLQSSLRHERMDHCKILKYTFLENAFFCMSDYAWMYFSSNIKFSIGGRLS